MRQRAIGLFLILAGIFVVFRFCNNKPDQPAPANEKQNPLSKSANSQPFDISFSNVLARYYSLKDALAAGDSSKANASAALLMAAADSLKVDEIKGDSSGTIKESAKYFAQTISGSGNALKSENDLDAKKKEFEIITESLWSLTRIVQYSGQKVYYYYCPTAFKSRGAYWMSNTRDVRNPYSADQSSKCGEVADSLDYSKQ